MSHGGTSSAERMPFVEAAHFVCTLMGPVPLGVMVLAGTGRCVAANATLAMLSRSSPDTERLEGTLVQLGSLELGSAFARALRGEVVMVETESPPALEPAQGLWRLHFLPFVVDEEHGAAVLFEDMTEHRLTTEAFRAAEQRFRLLVDSAADGIVIFRAQILLYLNPEAVRLFGFQSSDELVGRPLVELVQLEHRASFDLRLGDAEAGSGAGLFETAFLRRDGSSFPVECRASRARVDEMGAGYLFFRDIAERKRLQARRENARRVDALARLSTSIGAELQSYVTELRRWIGREKTGSMSTPDTTTELQNLADSMATRANAYSLSHQTAVESASSTTLEELLARICNSLVEPESFAGSGQNRHVPARLGEPSHELLVDLEPIPYPVRGEPSSIETGLTLLARAALKARVNDSPLCIRGARLSAADGDTRTTYRLSIAGGKVRNGGSSSPYVNSTFPPMAWTFGSWEQGRDLEVLGAFAILQAQGCWVEVQPCTGGGHCFEVELSLDTGHSLGVEYEASLESPVARPIGVPAVDEMPPDTERSRDRDAHPAERATAPVLICDDEARLVALTAGLLREFGFEVLTVRSGADAVRAVATHPVDVVILDVNLPGEDAQDIVTQLRSHSGVSVILSSGYTEEDIEPALLHDDAVKAFLAKPYGVETLVDTIDQVRMRAKQPSALEDGLGR